MKTPRLIASASALALPLLLSGCFVLSTTRKLPIPVQPAMVKTATAEELVAQINQQWDKLQTLNATVEMQLSVENSDRGVAKDYTSIPAVILLRKPEMLRVFGMVPVIRTRAVDMVSDGKNFTLWIPSQNKAIKGSANLTKKSARPIENLRPGFFYDAMVVGGIAPEENYIGSRRFGDH